MNAGAAPLTLHERELMKRVEREIVSALREIRFGSIELVIHDGRLVQIERREKLRLDPLPVDASATLAERPKA